MSLIDRIGMFQPWVFDTLSKASVMLHARKFCQLADPVDIESMTPDDIRGYCTTREKTFAVATALGERAQQVASRMMRHVPFWEDAESKIQVMGIALKLEALHDCVEVRDEESVAAHAALNHAGQMDLWEAHRWISEKETAMPIIYGVSGQGYGLVQDMRYILDLHGLTMPEDEQSPSMRM